LKGPWPHGRQDPPSAWSR